MDIHQIILNAKIGRERKAAQKDTCGIFAVALHDVLIEHSIPANLRCAAFMLWPFQTPEWYHSVVEVKGRFYDSKGVFSHDIVRKRLGIHPKVKTRIDLRPDDLASCFDERIRGLA